MLSQNFVSIFILFLAGLVGVTIAAHIAIKLRRGLNFRSLIILTYVLVNVVSGIAHLTKIDPINRGYYDLADNTTGDKIPIAIWITLVGLGVLCFSCMRALGNDSSQRIPETNIPKKHKKELLFGALIMLPPSLIALQIMSSYAQTVDNVRIISLDNGMARIGFLSQWFTWSVSFIALWLATTSLRKNRLSLGMILTGCVLLIVLSLSWTGGRTIAVMMCLPLILTLWPVLGKIRWLLGTTYLIAAIAYSVSLTALRTANYSSANIGLGSALDWQLGRFSMLGFAQDYVNSHGYMYGETFLYSILFIPTSILKLLGFNFPLAQLTSITEVSGANILGSSEETYVVPGMSAELYMNLGLVGVITGYYLLGRTISAVDNHFAKTIDIQLKFALAFTGVLLIFCTISSQSSAILNYALFTGLPVMILLARRLVLERKDMRRLRAAGVEKALDSTPGSELYRNRP